MSRNTKKQPTKIARKVNQEANRIAKLEKKLLELSARVPSAQAKSSLPNSAKLISDFRELKFPSGEDDGCSPSMHCLMDNAFNPYTSQCQPTVSSLDQYNADLGLRGVLPQGGQLFRSRHTVAWGAHTQAGSGASGGFALVGSPNLAEAGNILQVYRSTDGTVGTGSFDGVDIYPGGAGWTSVTPIQEGLINKPPAPLAGDLGTTMFSYTLGTKVTFNFTRVSPADQEGALMFGQFLANGVPVGGNVSVANLRTRAIAREVSAVTFDKSYSMVVRPSQHWQHVTSTSVPAGAQGLWEQNGSWFVLAYGFAPNTYVSITFETAIVLCSDTLPPSFPLLVDNPAARCLNTCINHALGRVAVFAHDDSDDLSGRKSTAKAKRLVRKAAVPRQVQKWPSWLIESGMSISRKFYNAVKGPALDYAMGLL